ncbi:leucine zipper putative tumor suppressor 3-like [Denticeps clupeoides]|uniref:Leucine zipper tumor suppressor 3 n=1 Tax=Denticeps clupeoides TaxID=299321 RepID=A0AAY4CYL0_9TELE|nr:leucine zipper putative tumor suppressor 3-like [Denticeps clupeoides]
MGSVGSGVAGEQEFAMKSVGTRTTLPRSAPHPLSRRSVSAERVLAPPPPPSEGTVSSDDRGSGTTPDRPPPTSIESSSVTNTERSDQREALYSNTVRRDYQRVALTLEVTGNGANEKGTSAREAPCRDPTSATVGHRSEKQAKILPTSSKMEQKSSALVRPSAFKPVVPKSFHSMQNLLGQAGGGGAGTGGRSGGGAAGGIDPSNVPQPLRDQDSPPGSGGGAAAGGAGQGGMSDSGRNSLTSLPTYAGSGSVYGPPSVLGPLSASTSHINRLGTTANVGATAGDKLDRPAYQNGLSATDSGRSSGKSSLSYQRLFHMVDMSATIRPSPSSDDIIQDLEDRLWEKEQEVLHMRRSLDQSEAAIVQVFEEKQRVWEREMEDLRQNYACRLQQVTRRAQRSEQALQGHISRLQQDKARLQDEMAALLAQREELERKCLDYRKEQADILPRLEETKWEVCQKVGEISLLKQQLRESQAEVTQRAGEMVALRSQLKELTAQLKQQEEAMLALKESYSAKSLELKRCEGELQRTLVEVSMLRDKLVVFEAEVLGLRRALGQMSSANNRNASTGVSVGVSTGVSVGVSTCVSVGVSTGSSSHWASLPCPRSPSDPTIGALSSLPPLPMAQVPCSASADAFLSLQSDEAKVQRQEAGELRRQVERLQGELRLERQQRERQALTFSQERHTWHDEKERVLKYQAQLQLSYVETLQRNQVLEERVGHLGPKAGSSSPSPPSGATTATALLHSPLTLSQPPPIPEELKPPPSLHHLVPPWPVATRLERIESTEI